MAYMSSFFRSLITSVSGFCALLAEVVSAHLPFRPSGNEHVELDRIGREADAYAAPRRARAKSFASRALAHARWLGDHFDPGRGVRLTLA